MDENKTEKVKGHAKEAAGDVTGDEDLEREGKVDRAAGEAKEKVGRAKEKAEELVDRAKDATKRRSDAT